MGTELIVWTARGAVACYAARLIAAAARRSNVPSLTEIVCWASGWALLTVHVACAFHFEHHWSHAAAYVHTARRTAETIGWNWGGGLYFNDATLALWGADVVVLIRSYQAAHPAPRCWSRFVMAWISFMILNATLVFGPRWWWAAAVFAALFAATRARRQQTEPTDSAHS